MKKAKRAMWHGDLDNERVMRHKEWAKKRKRKKKMGPGRALKL